MVKTDSKRSVGAQCLAENLAHRLVHGNAEHRARRPAIRTPEETFSYECLAHLVDEAEAGLAALGVGRGDRVVLVLSNGPAYLVAALAVMARGAVAVPLVRDAGPALTAAAVDRVQPQLILLDETATAPRGAAVHARLRIDGRTVRIDPSIDGGRSTGTTADLTDDDPAMILFSSGSTGRPKGVVLRHSNLLWNARTISETFGIDEDHREIILSSLAHSGAWQRATATLFAGGSLFFDSGPLTIPGLLETVAEYEIRGFYTAPPLVRYLLKVAQPQLHRGLASCRTLEIGSAPLAAEELTAFMDRLPDARIFVHYGMTECSRALLLDARTRPDKSSTVGRPAPGVDVSIVDDEGQPMATGEAGQILVRGRQASSRYWGQPELTAERFRRGWVMTGDYGSLDDEGFLTLLGRRDDMINSGGRSFFPAEIEAALGPVSGVSQYLIAGYPDPSGVLGQLPVAFAIGSSTEAEFLAVARRRLPPHMMPRRMILIPEFPLTHSGKPDRRATVAAHGEKIYKE